MPRCLVTGRCVECTEHEQCRSQLCDMRRNECAPEGAVLFVDASTVVDGDCSSPSEACWTVNKALSAAADLSGTLERVWIRVSAGTYAEALDLDNPGIAITLVGDDAKLVRPGGNVYVLVHITQGDLEAQGMVFEGEKDTVANFRLAAGRLALYRCVSRDSDLGVDIDDGHLDLIQSEIKFNRFGVSIAQGTSRVIGNVIADNSGDLSGTGLYITDLSGLEEDSPQHLLAYNTIWRNGIGASASGVSCNASYVVMVANAILGAESPQVDVEHLGGICSARNNYLGSFETLDMATWSSRNLDLSDGSCLSSPDGTPEGPCVDNSALGSYLPELEQALLGSSLEIGHDADIDLAGNPRYHFDGQQRSYIGSGPDIGALESIP